MQSYNATSRYELLLSLCRMTAWSPTCKAIMQPLAQTIKLHPGASYCCPPCCSGVEPDLQSYNAAISSCGKGYINVDALHAAACQGHRAWNLMHYLCSATCRWCARSVWKPIPLCSMLPSARARISGACYYSITLQLPYSHSQDVMSSTRRRATGRRGVYQSCNATIGACERLH